MPSTRQQLNRCWVLGNSLGRTMEDTKNTKDPKKDKESPELKEELTDEELEGVSGGVDLAGVAIPMYDGYEGRE